MQTVSADFGDRSGIFAPSAATLDQTVVKANTTTTLTSSANPSQVGQAVTFTATVTTSVGATPVTAGMVTFSAGSGGAAGQALDGNGQASFTTSAIDAGLQTVSADFNGTAAYNPSGATLTQQVTNQPPRRPRSPRRCRLSSVFQ